MHPLRVAVLLLFPLLPAAAAEPVRQPANARLWLQVPPGQPPLADVRVSAGTATPAPWENDPAVRARLTDILFPVSWWEWRSRTVSFTSPVDGTVRLTLHGPWEEKEPGVLFREEVLWKSVTAEGTAVRNGRFEAATPAGPEGWTVLYQDYPAADAWPLAGAGGVAATWQNRPMSQELTVEAGVPVTLTLTAKAATPPDFTPPKRLGADTAAHRALAEVKRGVNLGNHWESPPGQSWGVEYTTADIDRIAAEGFDHIRVPVAWHFHLRTRGDGMEIDPALLAGLEPVLRRALEKDLHVFLDWHHFEDLTSDPPAHRGRFIAGWEAIARQFQAWPAGLFFELLNEPKDALTTEAANPLYADAIAAIRRIDPQRIVVVSPGNWGDPRELDRLRLPDADERIVVTVHCYEPFHFTHQGANWVGLQDLRGIVYPGPPATPLAVPGSLRGNAAVREFVVKYNTLPAPANPCSATGVRDLLELARTWSRHFGRPVHLGEFGSHAAAGVASRRRYTADVRRLAEDRGIPWALWDWKAGFRYWDAEAGKPLLREALFGPDAPPRSIED